MSYVVEIVPYDPIWPARFAQLGSELRAALGTTALRIDHIIWEIMAKADRWSQEIGWEPGPSDA